MIEPLNIPTKADNTTSTTLNIVGSDLNSMRDTINALVALLNQLVIDGVISEDYLPSLYLSDTTFGGDNTGESPITVIAVES